MQAYYTLFDAENSRIGLARSVNYPYEQITTMTSEAEGSSLVLIGGILGGLAVAGCLLYSRRKAVLSELMTPLLRDLGHYLGNQS